MVAFVAEQDRIIAMVWRAVQQSTHQIIMMTWRERQDLVSDPLVRELLQKAMNPEFLAGLDEDEWDFRPSHNHRKLKRKKGRLRTVMAFTIDGLDLEANGIRKVQGERIWNTEDVDDGELLLLIPIDQLRASGPSTMRAMRGGRRKLGREKSPEMKRYAIVVREEGSEARVFSEVKREHIFYDFRVIMETSEFSEVVGWCKRHFGSKEREAEDERVRESSQDREET